MCGLWYRPAVAVSLGLTAIAAVIYIFPVISDFQRQRFCDQLFLRQPEHQRFGHFSDNEFGFIVWIGAG